MNLHSIKQPVQSYLNPGDRAQIFRYNATHEWDGTPGTVTGSSTGNTYVIFKPDPETRLARAINIAGDIYCLPSELRPL